MISIRQSIYKHEVKITTLLGTGGWGSGSDSRPPPLLSTVSTPCLFGVLLLFPVTHCLYPFPHMGPGRDHVQVVPLAGSLVKKLPLLADGPFAFPSLKVVLKLRQLQGNP